VLEQPFERRWLLADLRQQLGAGGGGAHRPSRG
jgi:hypothetical protein